MGWVPPRGEQHGPLAESVAGQWVMRFMSESKMLPASVLNRKVNEKAEHIEKTEGRKPGKKELRDLRDDALLALLQLDADRTLTELGDAVGLSASAVQRRIKRYRESGLLRQVAVLDPEVLPFTTLIAVWVIMERESMQDLKAFYARMREMPEVQQCYQLAGDWDYLLIIATPTLPEYRSLIERLFKSQKNVKRIESRVVLDTVKRGLALPSRPSP